MPQPLRVLIPAEQIQHRIAEMAREIDQTYPQGVMLVGILKGSFIFVADLARALTIEVKIDFMGISSYGAGKQTSGEVRLTKDLDMQIEGQDVLIVEDIVDSGVTLHYLSGVLQQRQPRSIAIATLLDKPENRQREIEVRYAGFQIPNEFVVGYGLDHAEQHRNLKDVCVVE